MAILSPDTWQFICAHRTEDVRTLALQARKYPQVDMAAAVVQIAGWQIAEKRFPFGHRRKECNIRLTCPWSSALRKSRPATRPRGCKVIR